MRTLAIVERAWRGTLEQQYAHVLWLVHALHRQSPMTLVLRGAAAVYALDDTPAEPLRLGDVSWGVSPDYRDALERLLGDGALVHVSESSLSSLGLGGLPTVPGVTAIGDAQMAELAGECDRIWYL